MGLLQYTYGSRDNSDVGGLYVRKTLCQLLHCKLLCKSSIVKYDQIWPLCNCWCGKFLPPAQMLCERKIDHNNSRRHTHTQTHTLTHTHTRTHTHTCATCDILPLYHPLDSALAPASNQWLQVLLIQTSDSLDWKESDAAVVELMQERCSILGVRVSHHCLQSVLLDLCMVLPTLLTYPASLNTETTCQSQLPFAEANPNNLLLRPSTSTLVLRCNCYPCPRLTRALVCSDTIIQRVQCKDVYSQ